jgi:phage gpG-like protein
MDIRDLTDKITKDFAVELEETFDRNFEDKGFFGKKWKSPKVNNSRGSMMNRSGRLRDSIKCSVNGNMILFSSSLPYASIHNEGGEITVTESMKKYFWAMYYRAKGATTTVKNGSQSKSKKNIKLNSEALQWQSLALMKVGQKIKVEKRQMVGNHPEVSKIAKVVIDDNIREFNEEMIKKFKR